MHKDTGQKIYTGSDRQGGEPYVLLGIKYDALRLMLSWLICPPRYPALLYIVQEAGSYSVTR
jgi:hypothetical protein